MPLPYQGTGRETMGETPHIEIARPALLRRGRRLEYFTIAYNLLEGLQTDFCASLRECFGEAKSTAPCSAIGKCCSFQPPAHSPGIGRLTSAVRRSNNSSVCYPHIEVLSRLDGLWKRYNEN